MIKKVILLLMVIIMGCTSIESKKETKKEVKKIINFEVNKTDYNKIENVKNRNTLFEQEEFFEKTAIKVDDNTEKQYIYGDNKSGYCELFTNAYDEGEFYNIEDNVVINNFATFTNRVLNNRKDEKNYTNIYQYGSTTYFENGSKESFYLIPKENSIVFNIQSKEKSKLGFFPKFLMSKSKTIIEKEGNVIILSFPHINYEYPKYIAITGDKDFNFSDEVQDLDEIFKKILRVRRYEFRGLFTTKELENDFRLVLSFANTKEEAIKKVNQLSVTDVVNEHKNNVYKFLTKSFLWTDDIDYNKAVYWSKMSSYSMFVEQFGKGIWAGLPWFRQNWGRDTFIALPGTLIVSGEMEDSKAVIDNFARYQNKGDVFLEVEYSSNDSKIKAEEFIRNNFLNRLSNKGNKLKNHLSGEWVNNIKALEEKIEMLNKIEGLEADYYIEKNKKFGRVPNRVASKEDIIYNTTDGTPWMIREIYEYLRYSGDTEYAKEIYPVVKLGIDGAIENYVDENGFLTHENADTWMDAKIDGNLPWSSRGKIANDIQALWYTTLKVGEYLAIINNDGESLNRWKKISSLLKIRFTEKFWNSESKVLADRIRPDNSADEKIRPNQLMVLTIPFEDELLDKEKGAYVVKNAINNLLYPYGIASLDQEDEYFHPYHSKTELNHKDAAYHNGTIWGWNAGFAISSMVKYGYSDFAYKFTENLTNQILTMGTIGSMSENIDAFPDENGEITLTGTFSQAWSVSEFNRNAYQDYLGFNPNLLKNEINFLPSIPNKWNKFNAVLDFGNNSKFIVSYIKEGSIRKYEISIDSEENSKVILNFENFSNFEKYKCKMEILNNEKVKIEFNENDSSFYNNGIKIDTILSQVSFKENIGELNFIKANFEKEYKSRIKSNYLKEIIENGQFR